MLEIREATPLEGFRVRLALTNGDVVERDIEDLLWGPVFGPLRSDRALYCRMFVAEGTLAWPGNLDLAPETLVWGESMPSDERTAHPLRYLKLRSSSRPRA